MNADRFMEMISTRRLGVMSPENPKKIRELVSRGQPITFFNWVCPPRTSVWIPDRKSPLVACRFFGPNEPGFLASEPCRRLADVEKETRTFLEITRECGVNFRYVKMLADDNPWRLYPPSLDIQGEAEIKEVFLNFFIWYQEKLDEMFGPGIEVVSWREMYAPYNGLYNSVFSKPFTDICAKIPVDVVDEEGRILAEHCGFKPDWQLQIRDFTERVIRSYAAEGVVLNALEEDWALPNQIMLCDESTRVFPAMIEAGRKMLGIPPLPKIFVLYHKRR